MLSTNWLKQRFKGDPWIWGVVIGLSLAGLAAVYSATGTMAYKKMGGDTEYYLIRHSSLVLLGFVAMWFTHRFDYRHYDKWSKIALILSIPLLAWASFAGTKINDAGRWITIPFINKTFQPSDLAKLALLAALASMLSRSQQQENQDLKSMIRMLAWIAAPLVFIAHSNVSTAVILFTSCMMLMYVGRVKMKYLLSIVLLGAIIGGTAIAFGQRSKTFVARIERFISGETVFQVEQSFIAVASGGLFGKGPGNSHQKDFLPHPYSDFIYAIIIEEYGMLIGGVGVLSLYLLLLYRGIIAASKSNNAFGGLLSAGLSFILTIQAMVHMAACVGVIPVTGQTLPLVSMGGTSLLFTGVAFGIILSVSRGEFDSKLGSSKKVASKENKIRNKPRS
jgi:cell division protein FtsW